MIRSLYGWYFSASDQYTNPVERQRASALLVLNLALIVTVFTVWVFILIPRAFTDFGGNLINLIVGMVLPSLVIVGLYVLIRKGQLRVASRFVVVAIGLISLPQSVIVPPDPITGIFPAIMPIIAAGALLERRGIIITTLIVLALIFLGPLRLNQTFTDIIDAQAIDNGLFVVIANIIFAALLLLAFSGRTNQIVREILVDNDRLQALSELNAQINENSDESDIFAALIDTIRRRFGYTLVQIYRLNEEGDLTNEPRGAQARLAFGSYTTISLRSDNALSEAARDGYVVRVSQFSPESHRSHFLPNTRYGLAIPLIHQRHVLGVLDVQSTADRDFSDGTATALALLAEEAAANVDYVQKLNLTQRTLLEQQGANARLREQLAELRRQGELVMGSTWDTYLHRRGKAAIGYDFSLEDTSPIAASDMPDSLRSAFAHHEVTIEQRDEEQVLNVPIILRGEVMGVMAFSLPAGRAITARQKELAQNVASRLSSALENRRLFEQVEAQAIRERQANEVGALLLGATDVNTVLRLAASSFNDALGAVNTQIYLQPSALVLSPGGAAGASSNGASVNGTATNGAHSSGTAGGSQAGDPPSRDPHVGDDNED